MSIIGFRFLIFSSTLILLGLLEFFYSFKERKISRIKRWPANLGVGLIDIIVMKTVFPLGIVGVAGWAKLNDIGLFSYLNLNYLLSSILGFVLLDLAIYFQHVYSHKWTLLWRFHRVHHLDLDLDVTSAVRFHPIEILYSGVFKVLIILFLGINPESVLAFEIVLSSMAIFNHANLHIPAALDKVLRFFVVTPQMHIIHHSVERFESDTNFGFNFSCWDFLFKTYRKAFSSSGLIGQKGFEDIQHQRLRDLLMLPLKK